MTEDNYLIISPCRDEADFMRRTLDSVIAQTVKPSLWVIVDDGSTDKTPVILTEYAGKHDFIKIIRHKNRGHRSVGPGVIEAFYAGYESIEVEDFEYICKLDLDLELPRRYFEILLQRFKDNPRIGTCSGKPYFVDTESGKLVSEKCGDENSVGMTKLFRKECFDQIGGFVQQVMWDGIDGHRCRMLGWIACSWDEPDLRFIHLRPMGSSQKGMLTGRMRHGYGQYFMGTDLIYMTASALYRMTRPPFIIGGLAMWWGYVQSMLSGKERLKDPAFRSFMRKYQWSCLLRGKAKATAMLNEQRAPNWNTSASKSFSPTSDMARMTTLPTNIESLIRRHLGDDLAQAESVAFHTRGGNRGGVLRIPLESGGSVVVKVWRIQNLKERVKCAMHLSNGSREWRMHRLIHRAGVRVPEPLGFNSLNMADGGRYDVMAIEDLGETERGLPYFKRLILAGDESEIIAFEDRVIATTAEIVELGVVDIDHQLNNFLVDTAGRLLRIDFECARRPCLGVMPRGVFAEMVARLLASHVYAVQPDVCRTERFAERLYERLRINNPRVRALVRSSVEEKLESQHCRVSITSVVVLPV